MFAGRPEMFIPLLQRHYFQSVLSSMVYTRGGTTQIATTLSDDGSTLNFVTEEFAERAGLQQVGVWRGTIKQLKDTVELDAPMYQVFFQLAPPLNEIVSVLAIGTTAIGHRVPVEPCVMNVLCMLLNTRKEFVANPAGDIDILLGMESCGLLLKTQPLERTPIMRDLSVTKSPLSSLYNIKGAIGGLAGDGTANCVHSTKHYTTLLKLKKYSGYPISFENDLKP